MRERQGRFIACNENFYKKNLMYKKNGKRRRLVSQWSSVKRVLSEIAMSSSSTGTSCSSSVNIS